MSIEANSNVRFQHPRIGSGRCTIAWATTESQVNLGIAWCSPHDQFRRDRGRVIAEGRLNRHPLVLQLSPSENGTPKAHEIKLMIFHMLETCELNDILEICKMPGWALKSPRLA